MIAPLAVDHTDTVRGLDLSGVAVTAVITPDGRLAPVGGVLPKLIAAARGRASRRIHTVIVAADQELTDTDLVRDSRGGSAWRALDDDFVVLPATTLAEALLQLQANKGRWPRIECPLPAREPRFVGRERLFAFIRQFTAQPEPGYLALVGGMGTGKSTLLAELLHREHEAGRDPIFHIVSDRATSRDPDVIAGCLADRVRRKHRLVEPGEWRDRTVSGAERLSWALDQLGGRPEVLYLDAADQAQADRDHRLLPGALDVLPPGVACVITTRTNLTWLGRRRGVTVRHLDEFVDDRRDIFDFLQPYVQADVLPAALVTQIVGNPDHPPIFQTARMRLRELTSPATSETRRLELLATAVLWTEPPEDAIADEILRRQDEARRAGLTDDAWRDTLATFIAVQEDAITKDSLCALGCWQPGVTDRVLGFAASFFKPRLEPAPATLPYRFDHPGFRRALEPQITTAQLQDAHRALASGSARWSQLVGAARTYALAHRLAHLKEGGGSDDLADAIIDIEYLHAALNEVSSIDSLLPEVEHAMESVLPIMPGWLSADAVRKVLVADAHVLRTDPALLVQQLYNELVWDWSASLLGSRLRSCASRYSRPWLRQTHRLPEALRRDPALRSTLTGNAAALAVSISKDTGTVLSWDRQRVMRSWNARTGASCLEIRAFSDIDSTNIRQVVAAESTLLVETRDGAVGVWDGLENVYRATLTCPRSRSTCPDAPLFMHLSVSADGKTVVGAGGYQVVVWDVETGAGRTIQLDDDDISAVAITRDGTTVVTAHTFGRGLWVWNVQTGERRMVLPLPKDDWVSAIAITADGGTVVSATNRGLVKMWNARTGICLRTLEGHTRAVEALAITPDGATVVSGGDDHIVRVWDASNGVCLARLAGHTSSVRALAITPDGKTAVSGGSDVRVWSVGMGHASLHRGATAVGTLALTCDGATVVSGAGYLNKRDHTVAVWDGRTGDRRATFTGHLGRVEALTITPDGATTVSACHDDASADQTVFVWHTRTGRCRARLTGHLGFVDAVAVTPDGATVVTASRVPGARRLAEEHPISVWDARTGCDWGWRGRFRGLLANLGRCTGFLPKMLCRVVLTGHLAPVRALATTPDGHIIVSGSEDRTIRVWDAGNGACRLTLEGHADSVTSLAVTPDGSMIVSGSSDHTMRVWDAHSGVCRAILPVSVKTVAITDDGGAVVCGGWDNVLRVWNPHAKVPLATWHAPAIIKSVQVSTRESLTLSIGLTDEAVAVSVSLELVFPS